MFEENGIEKLRVLRKEGKEYTIASDDEGLAILINDGYELIEEIKEIVREPAGALLERLENRNG